MKNIYQILFPVLLFYSGCSLFDAESKPLEPIQTYFYAEINGERFDANGGNAAITSANGYSMLDFGGSYYAEELFPYRESVAFSIIYTETTTTYPLQLDSALTKNLGFNIPSAAYYENDGDVVISHFRKPHESDGFVTVELEELEDGRKTISGTFEMTVYLNKRIETAFPQQEQDTLIITNGQYLLELRDFRDE
ncbi:MAG: hypothetical protein JJ895_09160 [Balneolaceae bacterium]|nr:hypothetical protein [Balneolaceae bacterium]